MARKTLRLRRTNIVYPIYDEMPSLSELLDSQTLTQDLLDDLIEFEDAAFAKKGDGACTSGLERLIVVARKQRLLAPDALRRIFFHILRNGFLPIKCGKNELEALVLAYKDVMGELERGNPLVNFRVFNGAYYFGHHGSFNVDREVPFTHDEFMARRAVFNQCDKYISIPGMLDKIDRFLPFAADEQRTRRLLDVLRTIRYAPIASDVIELAFWGAITIVLLNPATRFTLLDDLVHMHDEIAAVDDNLMILKRYVDAIGDPDLSAKWDQCPTLHVDSSDSAP